MKEAGYIFVYLSYEDLSNNYVEFDDFKITHTKSNLIQANEYYPFGLQTANSWTRENTTGNNFLGNGGTELNPTSNLYDLEYRNYDPALGRMHQVDPMTDSYSSLTPYNFAFNDPVYWTDRNGADPNVGDPDHVTRRGVNAISNSGWTYNNFGNLNEFFSHGNSPGSGYNWTDGIGLSDWSANDGSQMYRDGVTAGLTDLGGSLYKVNPKGTPEKVQEINGRLGYWQDYSDTQYSYEKDKDGSILRKGEVVVGSKFVETGYTWWEDMLYEANKVNPVAIAANSIYAFFTGVDFERGNPMSVSDATINLAAIIPIGRGAKSTIILIKEGKNIIAKTPSQVPKLWREMVEQLTKPKLTTTVGKPYTYKGIVETASGVPDKLGPKSSWQKFKEIIAILGQGF